jgi:hypothetical protein
MALLAVQLAPVVLYIQAVLGPSSQKVPCPDSEGAGAWVHASICDTISNLGAVIFTADCHLDGSLIQDNSFPEFCLLIV